MTIDTDTDNLFAERPLLGWPGTTVRLFAFAPWSNPVDFRLFQVTLANAETCDTIYDGESFADASKAYLHPFVYHGERTDNFVNA